MDIQWRLCLFGGLRAERGDQVITRFLTRKTGALLGYLAYYLPAPHPRGDLIELLWPECEPTAGRACLSTALASLRRQLEPPADLRSGSMIAGTVIVADRASARLNPAAVTTDVGEFHTALQAAARTSSSAEQAALLVRAVELYRRELLSGYCESWIPGEQAALAEEYFRALQQLIALLERSGDLSRALEYAQRGVSADPLREEAHHELIRLLAAAGRPAAAVRQYRELERILGREYAAVPSISLQALVGTPRAQNRAVVGHSLLTRAPAMPTDRASDRAARPPSRRTSPHLTPLIGTVTYLLVEVGAAAEDDDAESELRVTERKSRRALLRRALVRSGGRVVEEADGVTVAAFARASDALAGVIALQQELDGLQSSPPVSPPASRFSLHTGEVESADAGQPELQHARRILLAAHPGQILLSESSAALLRQPINPDLRVVDRGLYHLPGAPASERLFQLCPAGMTERDLAPPNAPPAHACSMPVRMTRFFGREAEIARLAGLLDGMQHGGAETRRKTREEHHGGIGVQRTAGAQPFPGSSPSVSPPGSGPTTHYVGAPSAPPPLRGEFAPSPRLVTLTGPGGSGKTRLAQEVAERLRAEWRDRIPARACWFVPLVDLTDPRLIADKALDALRLPRSSDLEPLEQLIAFLARQPSLLLLDNFEHLIDRGLPVLQTLLERVPALTCLVTSRRRLGLEGEQEFTVPPLPVPDARRQAPVGPTRLSWRLAPGVWRLFPASPSSPIGPGRPGPTSK